jgi:hypothetical protein
MGMIESPRKTQSFPGSNQLLTFNRNASIITVAGYLASVPTGESVGLQVFYLDLIWGNKALWETLFLFRHYRYR